MAILEGKLPGWSKEASNYIKTFTIPMFFTLLFGWPWFLFTGHHHAWGLAVVGVVWDALCGDGQDE